MTEHRKDDGRVYKEGRFVLEPGRPLRFIEEAECEAPPNSSSLGRAIGVALKAYRSAGFALASGKYASWQALAPPQFRVACHVLVDRSDGLSSLTSPRTGRSYPLRALWQLSLPTWEPGPDTCPRCAEGMPMHAPGSTGTAPAGTVA